MLELYGDYLFERREFRQAASGKWWSLCPYVRVLIHNILVLVEAGHLTKAMIAHEKALQWQELFCLAAQTEMTDGDVIDMGYRVAGMCLNSLFDDNVTVMFLSSEDLVAKKRHSEAARVLLDYSMNIREAVVALVQGNHFSEARRIVCSHQLPVFHC